MKEIRVHARAGQGAITTAMLLATAAFEEGKYALAFPNFGAERLGAPMNAFIRMDSQPIRKRSQVRNPDYVIVQDPTLVKDFDVTEGVPDNGIVIINTPTVTSQIKPRTQKIVTVPASLIAEDVMGRADRANTALLGAFAAATGEIKMESLIAAIRQRFPGPMGEKNVIALQRAYEFIKNDGEKDAK